MKRLIGAVYAVNKMGPRTDPRVTLISTVTASDEDAPTRA